MQEDKMSQSSLFITLTYDTRYVPITKNGFMSLDKSAKSDHCQLFLKKLRKAKTGYTMPIKYFLVGEYGGTSNRPHYHAIIFNTTAYDVEKSWDYGSVFVGTVCEASVGYTLKYMQKEKVIPLHVRDDRVKEFQRQSKGLGRSYALNPKIKKWHNADPNNRMYLNIEDNKKIAMPRYYKDILYQKHVRKQVADYQQKKFQLELDKKMDDNPYYYKNIYEVEINSQRVLKRDSIQNRQKI